MTILWADPNDHTVVKRLIARINRHQLTTANPIWWAGERLAPSTLRRRLEQDLVLYRRSPDARAYIARQLQKIEAILQEKFGNPPGWGS